MRKRRRNMLIILAFAGLGIFAWVVLRQHEPSYQGKPLRVWLEAYGASLPAWPDARDAGKHQESAAAIVRIGTNGLPVLLRMLQAKDSAMKRNLVILARKQNLIPTHLNTDEEYRWLA